MANLLPTINLCPSPSSCKTLRFYETTGVYNAFDNSGGYGTVNPDAADCSVTDFSITDPNGEVWPAVSFANVWLTPSDDTEAWFGISNTEMGLDSDQSFIDGFYEVMYEVTDTNTPPINGTAVVSTTQTFLITCQLECCLMQKLLDIKTSECNCYDEDIEALVIASMVLKAAKYSARCGKLDDAERKFKFVQRYCASIPCHNC